MRKAIIGLIIFAIGLGTYIALKPEVQGKVLRHEDFRGTEIPIIADGKGGTVRVITKVPWAKFSSREKMSMVIRNGGYLSIEDLKDIWFDYGAWKYTGDKTNIIIKKIKSKE